MKLNSSLQKLLFFALGLTLGLAGSTTSSRAGDRDDDQPALRASLPDEGQPPAPRAENAVVEQAPIETATVDKATVETATVDKATTVETTSPAAEVTSSAQVEKLPEAASTQAASTQAASTQAASTQAAAVQAEATPDEIRELSVEPVLEKRPMLPADRPAWVAAPNDTSERVHRLFVASFNTNTREEAETDDALDEPMVAAVKRYLDETVFPGQGALELPITADFIRQNLLDKSTSYVAAMTTQSGTEYQKWVVLQVTPEQRDYFADRLREHKQRERMAMLGVTLAGVLGLTGLANLAFNRRRRRYPNALTPINMVIMPGSGGDLAAHQVAAAPPIVPAAPKKRSFALKSLIFLTIAGLMFAFSRRCSSATACRRSRTQKRCISVFSAKRMISMCLGHALNPS